MYLRLDAFMIFLWVDEELSSKVNKRKEKDGNVGDLYVNSLGNMLMHYCHAGLGSEWILSCLMPTIEDN